MEKIGEWLSMLLSTSWMAGYIGTVVDYGMSWLGLRSAGQSPIYREKNNSIFQLIRVCFRSLH